MRVPVYKAPLAGDLDLWQFIEIVFEFIFK